jgi:hypothetical protein
MPCLSVNLNKIALLRNSRRTGVPDVMRFGRIAHDAGADGLTAHPRPDERHIRRTDVFALAELMKPWRPGFELNLEGYPDRRFLDIVAAAKPEQCTLVPDSPDAFTSERKAGSSIPRSIAWSMSRSASSSRSAAGLSCSSTLTRPRSHCTTPAPCWNPRNTSSSSSPVSGPQVVHKILARASAFLRPDQLRRSLIPG